MTERQKDRKTERQKDRKTEREKDRRTERYEVFFTLKILKSTQFFEKDRATEKQEDRKTDRQNDRTENCIHRQKGKQKANNNTLYLSFI
jgi:hypothetical protein